MKNWFMSKSIAVRAAVIVLALAVVAEAALGVASLSKKETKNIDVVTVSDEAVPTTAAEAEESTETTPEKVVEDTSVVATTDEQPAEAIVVNYVKESTDLENGDFSDGLNAWEVYSALNENITATADDYFNIDINETGTEDWHVQLKQTGIRLVSGKWYVISFDAKSSINRSIACAMQRDGMIHNDDWTPYANSTVFTLSDNWRNCTMVFRMPESTDNASVISFSMGAVAGKKITTAHSVSIDNVSLKQLPDNWTDSLKEGDNLIGNPNFEYADTLWEPSVVTPGEAKYSFDNNKATFVISNTGSVDWHVQLKQSGLKLENNTGYRLTFKASSSVARTIKTGFMDTGYVNWYGGGDVALTPDEKLVTVDFYNSITSDSNAVMMISMGKVEGIASPASTITLSDFRLVKCDEVGPSAGGNGGAGGNDPSTYISGGWMVYDHQCAHTYKIEEIEGGVAISIMDTGDLDWHVQLQKKNTALTQGKYYKITYEAKSTVKRDISCVIQRDGSADENWTAYSGSGIESVGTEWKTYTKTFCMNDETDLNGIFNFSLGTVNGKRMGDHTVSIRNISIEQVRKPKTPTPEAGDEMLNNNEFKNGKEGWETYIASAASATESFRNNKAVFNISNAGENSWDVQLKQTNLKLEKGETYTVVIDTTSSVARDIKVDFLKSDNSWLGGTTFSLSGASALAEGSNPNQYTFEFTMSQNTVDDAVFTVSMGKVGTTPASKITINSISLKKNEKDDSQWIVDLDRDESVTNQDQYKGNVSINPADYVEDYSGKDVKVTAKLKASMWFGGAICGNTTTGWYNGTQNQCDDPGVYTWEETITSLSGNVEIQIRWSGAPTIEILEVTMEVVEGSTETPEDSIFVYPNANNKGEYELKPSEYGLTDYQGKDVKITLVLESTAVFNGAIGGTTLSEEGWSQSETFESADGSEMTWEYTIPQYNDFSKVEFYWIGGQYVEIKSVTMSIEGEEPETESVYVYPNANNKGEYELKPSEYGLTDYKGKDVKITLVLESTAVFNGAIGGTTLAEEGWTQSATFESADGSEMTWEYTISQYNDFSKVEFYWIGGEYVEIKSVTMAIVEEEEPAAEKFLVYANDNHKGEAALSPADYGLTDYKGKDVKITLVLESTAVFNGAIGGTTLAEEGWTQSETFESADGSEMTWEYTISQYNDFSKVEFYWIGGEYVEIKSVTMAIVEKEEPAAEKWLVYANDNHKGEAALSPADFGLSDYQGKDVKITLVLESTAVFNGAIGGTTLAEEGWTQSETFESADGSAMTWEYTIHRYNDFSKVEFYWIGGEYVEIKSVSMEIIPSDNASAAAETVTVKEAAAPAKEPEAIIEEPEEVIEEAPEENEEPEEVIVIIDEETEEVEEITE